MTGAAALAVDAGQSTTRAALVDGTDTVAVAEGPGVARLGGAVGPREVADRLVRAIAGLGPLPLPCPPAAVGLSGFEAAAEPELAELAARLTRAVGTEEVAIATDGLPALLGALGDEDGVVVAAGTGTACLGRRGARFAKVDGWGALLGDAGSGFWIGRAGLDAALRRFDGRGDADALMAAAERRFGPVDRLADRLHRDPSPVPAVASFARDVAALARAGDPHASAIAAAAGAALAETAGAALARLFAARTPVPVSYTGNVLRGGSPVRDAFAVAISARWPHADVRAPVGDALRGAALLARLAPELEPLPGVLWRSR